MYKKQNLSLTITPMTCEYARQIGTWVYGGRYFIYSLGESAGYISDLLNGSYYAATDEGSNLIGYFCFGKAAQVPAGRGHGMYDDTAITDIGLGIKPSLCGQGLGVGFVNKGIEFARKNLSAQEIRLTVAAFNRRAITVYERTGFRKVASFIRSSEINNLEFWVMMLG
jgi:Acetyltransferases, including N-acetylases of ribosomal proteins